jgi:hypothetical protein
MDEEREYIVYNFKWKEIKGEWQTLEVVGHKFYEDTNRMVLYRGNGGIFEIPSWNEHYSDLGEDWANKVKLQYEEELAKKPKDKEETSERQGHH